MRYLCRSGLGTILPQGVQPVAYAFHSLTRTERNYAQVEKNVFQLSLLLNDTVQIMRSDRKPLMTIFSKPILTSPKRSSKDETPNTEVPFKGLLQSWPSNVHNWHTLPSWSYLTTWRNRFTWGTDLSNKARREKLKRLTRKKQSLSQKRVWSRSV